ncbi:NADP-dependent phosphogluconate dehydrogenase [Antarcticibacterium sp. 1MA-6-2]|uniref:NADP-dependent phosphogluconate dehydrogenase n=1 Tax=Antarcticibacterium sp. 1MA-6-2 TaxID=2908210 RepID=UPI001F36E0C3|nr:NADP-dependent phosphogluconate dehydrogenase [Antarcticibacterium sp. 1MA-6-2]UJH91578.1 NADP-dependent phosphogluconate dehydrogenase [Antarcticibacterium sp. 1MA-6-2]
MIYIVSGVSGVGKTTIGILLSKKLKLPFYDADDFHPEDNITKMGDGIPLQDEDREGWLENLSQAIRKWNKDGGAVLACSALKEQYRRKLESIPKKEITWIFLHSEFEIILERLNSRKGHYFKPALLQSQYATLEFPGYGIHINVNKTEQEVLDEIMEHLNNPKSEIGLLGLGVMGKSLAINLASNGVKVAVFNRHVEKIEVDIAKNFALENKEIFNFPWFDDLEKFINSLERPRNIFFMVNAGKTVDIIIESLLPFLEEGDLIIDGGNSHYKDTLRREQLLKESGILFMGTGVSGGEEGARKGPSIMPGGSKQAYERVGSFLEKIAAKDKDGNPCCTYIGPEGAGHFVKMLHNGIEYAEMQLIAEYYHFFRFGLKLPPDEIAGIFTDWNKEMQSYLLEISIDILKRKENDDYLLDRILDAAKQKGTGGWSTNAALELGVPFDTITAAVMARIVSGKKEERVQVFEKYNSTTTNNISGGREISSQYFSAYKAGSIINHAIGFSLLTEASAEYKWNLNLSEIARIWTNGCIIRSAFMEELIDIFKERPGGNLLLHPVIINRMKDHRKDLLAVISEALKEGFPVPVLSAAGNYFLAYTSEQTSANMIQAQRDYFGAHTYERNDKSRGEFFHTNWKPGN